MLPHTNEFKQFKNRIIRTRLDYHSATSKISLFEQSEIFWISWVMWMEINWNVIDEVCLPTCSGYIISLDHVPTNRFCPNLSEIKVCFSNNFVGIFPSSLLALKSRWLRFGKVVFISGLIVPVRAFLPKFNVCNFCKRPISVKTVPIKFR